MAPSRIAIVSSEPTHWATISAKVSDCGLELIRFDSVEAASEQLAREKFEVAICEDEVRDGGFRELIQEMKRSGCWTPVIVLSKLDDWGSYLEGMAAGAFDYLAFPPYPQELERAIEAALMEARSHRRTAKAA